MKHFIWGAILIDISMPDCKHHLLPAGSRRSGYTLVEILMATALALLLLVSVIRIFMMMNNGFAESRVLLEMLGRMRNAQRLLESDLSHYTVSMRPPRPVEADDGYFACGKTKNLGIEESSESDEKIKRGDVYLVNQSLFSSPESSGSSGSKPPFCSCKDYISLTVFNKEFPLRCVKSNTETLETPYAEVLWFVKGYDLYRVVVPLLLGDEEDGKDSTFSTNYRRVNLGHLGDPENRITKKLEQFELSNYMVLPNVIHFEVQLWSPSDNTYITLDELQDKNKGKYFWDNENGTETDTTTDSEIFYDTWSTLLTKESSEGNELDGDHENPIVTGLSSDPEGSNGKLPPSKAFLPGVRLVVRAFDPDTGQVREFRVAQDFRTR